MKKMNKKAFTLIELLIVIAIIGILFIVLVSKVDFATDKAKATGVQTDFRSFQMAFEQVAKENAGFTTFGWDTGDNAGGTAAAVLNALNNGLEDADKFTAYTNFDDDIADGVRNSYDFGDKNLDGKSDGETWTGRKVYTEKWNGVWTLVKPGEAVSTYDSEVIFALESAINKNLDPKLHITIGTDGKITMANQARDPWKVEYEGVLLCNAEATGKAVANPDSDAVDNLDRGAIVMYSKGANGKLGSIAKVDDGVVTVTVSTVDANTLDNNVAGKDDYSFSTIYTFKNGYGEVISATTGFSSNQ